MTRPIVAGGGWKSALLCLLFSMVAHTGTAQEIAGSFEQLQVLVKPGDTVTVRDATGVESKGTIAALSRSTLALVAAGTRLELSENDVSAIKQRRADSLANGALYGAAGGAAFASTALIIFRDNDLDVSEVALVLGLYTAMGTGIGVAVDALIRRDRVIFRRPPAAGLQVGLAPWLTSQQKGVLVSVRF